VFFLALQENGAALSVSLFGILLIAACHVSYLLCRRPTRAANLRVSSAIACVIVAIYALCIASTLRAGFIHRSKPVEWLLGDARVKSCSLEDMPQWPLIALVIPTVIFGALALLLYRSATSKSGGEGLSNGDGVLL